MFARRLLRSLAVVVVAALTAAMVNFVSTELLMGSQREAFRMVIDRMY